VADSGLNVVAGVPGAAPARAGYDHGWFPFSSLPARPPVRWPGGAQVAVSVVVDLGAVEWERHDPGIPPLGGRGQAPRPDYPRMSHREFGHRVGIFRLLRMLERHTVPFAAAVDVLTVEQYGALMDHVVPAASELLAAGLSASRPITSRMSADEESHYVRTTLDRLESALPARPAGWLGPGRGESARTPAVLGEAGVSYVADWCNDDLPYAVPGAANELWSFPLSWELSDIGAVFVREVSPDAYAESIRQAVARLRQESARGGRALGLHLHPWLSGQAFRAGAVEQLLAELANDDSLWLATPADVVAHCRVAA
jgi:allantoinase